MADPWIIKRHDTWPNWEGQLTDANGVVDLTNATSAKLLRQLIDASGAPVGGVQTLTLTFNSPRVQGFVTRDWASGDNDTVGTFKCEVEVTWNDGSVETFPNTGTYTMIVEPDLG